VIRDESWSSKSSLAENCKVFFVICYPTLQNAEGWTKLFEFGYFGPGIRKSPPSKHPQPFTERSNAAVKRNPKNNYNFRVTIFQPNFQCKKLVLRPALGQNLINFFGPSSVGLVLKMFLVNRTEDPILIGRHVPFNLENLKTCRRVDEGPYKKLHGTPQHLWAKMGQSERRTCDRQDILWAFSVGFRTGYHRPFVIMPLAPAPSPFYTAVNSRNTQS